MKIGAVVLFLALVSLAFARDAREQERINFLINEVANSTGIVFIRNGSEHDAHAAAEHLRMKLSYGGERIKTAEDFIKYCASESSLTHRPYQVRLADGKTETAAQYFTAKLRQFDAQNTR